MRGAPPADVKALAANRRAAWARSCTAEPRIAEIDINPLSVFAAGEGVLALDALIVAN